MTLFDAIGHAVLFFLSGFNYWVMQAGRHNLGTVLFIALPVAGVYFLGWWALLTFVLGAVFAARMFVRAKHSGKDPFQNPWHNGEDDNKKSSR